MKRAVFLAGLAVFILMSGCKKEVECYECIFNDLGRELDSDIKRVTQDFCGKDAKEASALWIRQKIDSEKDKVSKWSLNDEAKATAYQIIENSTCTKKK